MKNTASIALAFLIGLSLGVCIGLYEAPGSSAEFAGPTTDDMIAAGWMQHDPKTGELKPVNLQRLIVEMHIMLKQQGM